MDLAKGQVSGDITHFTRFAVLAVPKTGRPIRRSGRGQQRVFQRLPRQQLPLQGNLTRAEAAIIIGKLLR